LYNCVNREKKGKKGVEHVWRITLYYTHTYKLYILYNNIVSKLIVVTRSGGRRERHRRRAKGWCAADVGGVAAVLEYARTFGIYMGACISGHLTYPADDHRTIVSNFRLHTAHIVIQSDVQHRRLTL